MAAGFMFIFYSGESQTRSGIKKYNALLFRLVLPVSGKFPASFFVQSFANAWKYVNLRKMPWNIRLKTFRRVIVPEAASTRGRNFGAPEIQVSALENDTYLLTFPV